jgi:hypothetical protein
VGVKTGVRESPTRKGTDAFAVVFVVGTAVERDGCHGIERDGCHGII